MMFCVCSTEDEVDEEYRADHEMELMLADLLPKADIAAVGLCEEEMSKPFVEDLHETPEERARLETEKDEILCQLSKDVDFDLCRVRNYLGPNSVCGMVCAGCKKVAYCNYRCEKAHWKQHKKRVRML